MQSRSEDVRRTRQQSAGQTPTEKKDGRLRACYFDLAYVQECFRWCGRLVSPYSKSDQTLKRELLSRYRPRLQGIGVCIQNCIIIDFIRTPPWVPHTAPLS